MKRLIFLDTETTGFTPGQICQLAYIIQEGERLLGRNFFFTVEAMPAAARAVHGFSATDLRKLSQGREFAHHAREIAGDFQGADCLVAHNAAFDCRFLRTEFSRCTLDCALKPVICTMEGMRAHCGLRTARGGVKAPRLEELAAFLGISTGHIREASSRLFGPEAVRYHDARYDVTATYLCYREAYRRGMILQIHNINIDRRV